MVLRGRWLLLLLAALAFTSVLIAANLSKAQLEGLEGVDAPNDVTGVDCTMCHGKFAEQFEFKHDPAANASCESCHSPTGEEGHGALLADDRTLCLTCHAAQENHYMVSNCWSAGCHADMHGSDINYLLNPSLCEEYPGFSMATACAQYIGSDCCLACHPEQYKWWRESVHSLSDLDPDMAIDRKGCEGCHGPGSNHYGRRAGIGVFTEGYSAEVDAVCLKCHRDETYVPDYMQSRHYKSAVACVTCHNPHDTNNNHNLQYSANALCLDCHKQTRVDFAKLSHHPVDMADPVTGMLCVECHDPHGSTEAAMLNAPKEELCQTCHVDKAGPFIYAHPALEPAMGQGCATCHVSHGANSPDLLKISGRGLCLQCHNDRVTHFTGQTCWTAGCHTDLHGSNTNFFFFSE